VFRDPDLYFSFIPAIEAIQILILSSWNELKHNLQFRKLFLGGECVFGEFITADWMKDTSEDLDDMFGRSGDIFFYFVSISGVD